ncbi:hypothetical protein AMTR_s00040p00197040 [Amborella trichopoda]|uniref:Uncharacterized protein n=1 Tax=Amborella trichopoda TaxID=13333 RepID=W1PYK7_AMBTC|nr:hypothetical protein AMTR_s00040p00197040 [Amborella trichopoda]
MALQDDFESVRASILCRTSLPSVDVALYEITAEETWKGTIDNSLVNEEYVLLAKTRHPVTTPLTLSSSDATKRIGYDMSKVRCNYCKQFEHMKFNSPFKNKPFVQKTTALGLTAALAPSQDLSSLSHLTREDVQEMIQHTLSGMGTTYVVAFSLSETLSIKY